MKSADILLRPLQLEDMAAVVAIEQETQITPWSEGIFRDCLRAGYLMWVLECQGKVRGFIVANIQVGECHILNVCVKPIMQRMGYGRLLMQRILHEIQQRGVEMVFLEVRPSNYAAIRLYQQLGFNEIGMRKNYYATASGEREDALIFALQLMEPFSSQ